MPQSPDHHPDEKPSRPNILVRSIAGLSVSIRLKLLSAFLGVTLLMAGLAWIGLETLRQANDRTEKLLRDQARIAFFNDQYVYLSDLVTLATAMAIDPNDVQRQKTSGFFSNTSFLLIEGTNNLVLHTGQGLRTIGRTGLPDNAEISAQRANAKRLQEIARRAGTLRESKDYKSAGAIARQTFLPIALRMQRGAYSKVQDIEAEMAETAKSTALAYETSREMVITSALVAIGAAFFLGYAFSSSLIWPIRRIGETLGAIAGGQFDMRVTVPNRDELGDLARDVNATSQRLGELYAKVEAQRAELANEHARSERLLRNLLPDQIAARLKDDPTQTIADSLPSVAILFADIAGFTPRAAKMTPEEIVNFLNGLFSVFDELAQRHGLEKIKTIGDSYMVAAGAPEACDDPVHRVAEMALNMLEVARTFAGGVDIRIGLHAGPAVAGVIGHQKLFYDIWGETVNIASRMESHGEPGRIQATKPVQEQLRANYRFEPRGRVEVNGVGSVETWWLAGRLQQPGPKKEPVPRPQT